MSRRVRSEAAKNQKGVILLLTFIFMVVLSIITIAFLFMISTQTKGSGYDIISHKALWLAEAGLQQALYTLRNDSAYQTSPTTITASLGDGTYSVSAVKDGETYTFTSTGTVDVMNRKITQSVVMTSAVLDRSIHADGSIVNFSGSTGTVNGNISCKVQILGYEGMTINGDITEGAAMVNPTLDYDYYKTLAQAAGQYSTSNLTFSAGTYSGVYYTTKAVTIDDNAVINGTIVAEGSISFDNRANNITITPANNYPALATQLSISSTGTGSPGSRIGLQNSTINGLIIAGSNVTFDYMQNTTFGGTILAGNNLSMQNGRGFTMNYDENIFAPMPPGFTYSAGGDSTIISQKDWNEIVPAI